MLIRLPLHWEIEFYKDSCKKYKKNPKEDSTFTNLVSSVRTAAAIQYFYLKIAAFQIVIKHLFLKKPTQIVKKLS